LIIPHGKTQLQVGDRLAVVARKEDEDAIRTLMRKNNQNEDKEVKEETAS